MRTARMLREDLCPLFGYPSCMVLGSAVCPCIHPSCQEQGSKRISQFGANAALGRHNRKDWWCSG